MKSINLAVDLWSKWKQPILDCKWTVTLTSFLVKIGPHSFQPWIDLIRTSILRWGESCEFLSRMETYRDLKSLRSGCTPCFPNPGSAPSDGFWAQNPFSWAAPRSLGVSSKSSSMLLSLKSEKLSAPPLGWEFWLSSSKILGFNIHEWFLFSRKPEPKQSPGSFLEADPLNKNQ